MGTRFVSHILAILTVILGVVACGGSSNMSNLEFDSAHNVAIDVNIPAGYLQSYSTDVDQIKQEITEQLMYSIGQLNAVYAGPDMHQLTVEITSTRPLPDDSYAISYRANLLVSWPREREIPASYEFIVPARGDGIGLYDFFQAYGSDEQAGKTCLDWSAHDVTPALFWYYYRPLKQTCSLRESSADDPDLVVRVKGIPRLSEQNTEGKYPEYGKVWEDERLVATVIFGKNEYGATDHTDAGIQAYRQFYRDVIRRYGRPAENSLPADTAPGASEPEIRLLFHTPGGSLDLHVFLVDSIRTASQEFVAKYDLRAKTSDFISYSGHSGLGSNIRALARMGQFAPDQYQLFLVNGCDTFAYVDDALAFAHQEVNPDYGPNKFVDIITNATPSYFHSNSRSNMVVLDALLDRSKTYRELLAGFDPLQRAGVTGEEDNNWPQPFY